MENNGFKRAGSLEEPKINETFLKPAGSLEEPKINETFLKPAGSLEEPKINETFLKPAGSLEEPKINETFLKPAGSLEEPKINETFLKPAGSLEEPKINETFLKPAGDLPSYKNNSFKFEEREEQLNTPTEIREWLETVVSGEKKSNYAFGEGLLATSAGQKFVTIDELRQMINNGDNIIKADYYENMNMIFIEFESFNIPSKSR